MEDLQRSSAVFLQNDILQHLDDLLSLHIPWRLKNALNPKCINYILFGITTGTLEKTDVLCSVKSANIVEAVYIYTYILIYVPKGLGE